MSLLRNYCWAWSLHLSKLVCPERLFRRAPEFGLSRAAAVAGSFPSLRFSPAEKLLLHVPALPSPEPAPGWRPTSTKTCLWFLFVSSEGTGPRWLLGTLPQPGWGGIGARWVWGAMGERGFHMHLPEPTGAAAPGENQNTLSQQRSLSSGGPQAPWYPVTQASSPALGRSSYIPPRPHYLPSPCPRTDAHTL